MYGIMFKRKPGLEYPERGWQYARDGGKIMSFSTRAEAEEKATYFTLLLANYGYEYVVVEL